MNKPEANPSGYQNGIKFVHKMQGIGELKQIFWFAVSTSGGERGLKNT